MCKYVAYLIIDVIFVKVEDYAGCCVDFEIIFVYTLVGFNFVYEYTIVVIKLDFHYSCTWNLGLNDFSYLSFRDLSGVVGTTGVGVCSCRSLACALTALIIVVCTLAVVVCSLCRFFTDKFACLGIEFYFAAVEEIYVIVEYSVVLIQVTALDGSIAAVLLACLCLSLFICQKACV